MTDHESRELVVPARHHGSGLAQWAMVLTPIAAAYGQQQSSYAFVTWACSKKLIVLLHIPAVLALLLVGVAALTAWRTFLAAGPREAGDERSTDARARFMSACGLTTAGFATIVIIAQWLPTIFIHPCQR
jgi:hypothetical protein